MPKSRCTGEECPVWSRNGEHPATSADGILAAGWWVSGRGPAALAECRIEGPRGPVTASVGVLDDATVVVECSQGPWIVHVPWGVLALVDRRRAEGDGPVQVEADELAPASAHNPAKAYD